MKHPSPCFATFPNTSTFRENYLAARRIFNSLVGVWKCGRTHSFVFDISLDILFNLQILYANEAESINPVEKDKEEQQPEVSTIVFLTPVNGVGTITF